MIDFEQELDRFRAIVESTESFQLRLDSVEVRGMARQFYAHNSESARVVEDLILEHPPLVTLVDLRNKDIEDRKAIWKTLSDVYLGLLVAVNIPSSDSNHDYNSYLAGLSKDDPT